jgi:hypothetical protein
MIWKKLLSHKVIHDLPSARPQTVKMTLTLALSQGARESLNAHKALFVTDSILLTLALLGREKGDDKDGPFVHCDTVSFAGGISNS